jgi:hypothetical protein
VAQPRRLVLRPQREELRQVEDQRDEQERQRVAELALRAEARRVRLKCGVFSDY